MRTPNTPPTILAIDNNRGDRHLLDALLSYKGYRVLLAENGEKGLELLRLERPDVIVLDLKMEEMDGLTVLRHIRTVNPDQQVIIYSGSCDPKTEQQIRALGIIEMIKKACSLDHLEAALQHALMSLDAKEERPKLVFDPSVVMSECRHEWDEDLSGDQRLFICLKCGQRLDTASLTDAIRKGGEQLAMTIDLTRLAIIEGAKMPLSWTAEKPAVSGWFWLEDGATKVGPVIVRWTGSTYSTVGVEEECIPGEQSRWAGPLEPPPW